MYSSNICVWLYSYPVLHYLYCGFSLFILSCRSSWFLWCIDRYDYERAIFDILPTLVDFKVEKGGFIVLRPDSGDPVEAVMLGLEAAEKAFGSSMFPYP